MSPVYVLFADEAQTARGRTRPFFIYTALAFPACQIPSLAAGVSTVRRNDGDLNKPLKYSGGSQLDADILEVAASARGLLFTTFVHHSIIKNEANILTAIKYAINSMVMWFNSLLSEQDAWGMCYIDQRRGILPHCEKLLGRAETLPSGELIYADRICAFGCTSVEASTIVSCVDIAAGAMREISSSAEIPSSVVKPLVAMRAKGQTPSGRIQFNPKKAQEPAARDYEKLEKRLKRYELW